MPLFPPIPLARPRRYKAAQWYIQTGRVATLAMTVDRMYLVHIDVDVVQAFDRIGLAVTGAGTAGSIVRLGLYADDGTGSGPTGTDLLGLGSNIDGTSATNQAITIAKTLQPGRYWRAAVCQVASCTVQSTDTITALDSVGMVNQADGWSDHKAQAGVAGALPTIGSPTNGSGGPHIFMRAA